MHPLAAETYKKWQGFTTEQRIACATAFACTAVRPLLTAAIILPRLRERNSVWHPAETGGLAVAALTDMVDGAIAKRLDAVTPAGEAADPFADKIMMNSLEGVLVARGEMSAMQFATRVVRDGAISIYRKQITEESGGKVSIKAGPEGRVNTFARLATDIATASKLNQTFPRTFRGLRMASTVSTVVCGGISMWRMHKNVRQWRAQRLTEE